ncbi:hypothetical protein ACW14Y_41095 [Kitasatospora sp. cg17-2]
MREDRPTISADEDALIKELLGRSDHEDHPGLMALGGLGAREGALAVDLGSGFLGRPLRTSRDLLRRADPWGIQPDDAVRVLDADEPAALDFLAALVRLGLLSGPGSGDGRDSRAWKLTPTGRVLAFASGRRPSSRAAADALVAKVLKAAAAINENPDEHLWWVKSIRAVGHYADPSREKFLHIDLAVLLVPRLDDPREQAKAQQRMHDDALDSGSTDRVLDMFGYGHWRTRLALAGRSKSVRLFAHPDGVEGPVLFEELRDLTVEAAPSAAYEPPTDPVPATGCSWCRQQLPSTRVAAPGESIGRSPIALCDSCLPLGRNGTSGFLDYLSLFRAVRQTLDALAAEPYHLAGCALCGNNRATRGQWWPDRGRQQAVPVTLRLCTICPGLLGLADRPDREDWWLGRHEEACLAGFHARLRAAARVPLPRGERKSKHRQLPRLTEVHRRLLDDVRSAGVLSAVDLARRRDRPHHQNSKWWAIRIDHLQQHDLVTAVGADGNPWTGGVRILQDDERALRSELLALHVPGPVWDGTEVTEPQPPAGWSSRWTALATLRAEHDHLAMTAAAATAARP